MEKTGIAGHSLAVFRSDADNPVVYLHTAAEEGEAVFEALDKACTLVCISDVDWNRDMSPWPTTRVFKGGEDFGGGAPAWLAKLCDEIVPEVERYLGFEPVKRGIAGYSLGGLFALWALYNSDMFTLAASASGSLWYDGWLDYIAANKVKTTLERVYISVGDKEKNTRQPLMRTVEDCSRRTVEYFSEMGVDTLFELNEGNHFKDTALRMARGINYIVRRDKND